MHLHSAADIKERVRERADLVAVVSEHVALSKSGRGFRGLCPFHKEKTPSFHVLPDKGIFHCFGCKAGGDVFKFVQLREGVSFPEALRMLADRCGIEVEVRRAAGPGGPTRTDLGKINAWAAQWFRRQLLDPEVGRGVRAYLTGRSVAEETAERFEVGLAVDSNAALLQAARLAGLAPEVLEQAGLIQGERGAGWYDTFRNRLMFPIRDTTRRVIGFGGRTLGDARAKYLNTRQNDLFDKGRILYGVDVARDVIVARGRAILVEGYTDCLACHQAGFAETVATLGTAMTEAHAELLRRYCREVVLIFDSDDAGAGAAERGLRVALRHGLSVRLGFVPEGKDPCDYLQGAGAEAFERVLKSAVDALVFTWQRVQARYNAEESDSGRRQAVRELVDLVCELSEFGGVDPIQQGLIANQVAKLLNLRSEQVHGLFADSQRAARGRRPASDGAPVGNAGPQRPRFGSSEQAAVSAVLEVLLNESGFYPLAVNGGWTPERFENVALRRVAAAVKDLAERFGEFSLLEVLDAFHDPDDARLVTELHLSGERRGNFEATLEGALDCLKQAAIARQTADLARSLNSRDADGTDAAGESPSDRLEAIQQSLHSHRHFSPRSKLSAAREAGA